MLDSFEASDAHSRNVEATGNFSRTTHISFQILLGTLEQGPEQGQSLSTNHKYTCSKWLMMKVCAHGYMYSRSRLRRWSTNLQWFHLWLSAGQASFASMQYNVACEKTERRKLYFQLLPFFLFHFLLPRRGVNTLKKKYWFFLFCFCLLFALFVCSVKRKSCSLPIAEENTLSPWYYRTLKSIIPSNSLTSVEVWYRLSRLIWLRSAIVARLAWHICFVDRILHKLRMSKSAEDDSAFSRIYKKTEFDQLLLKIGGWSRFQHIQWVLLFLAAVPQAWYTYAPAFAAAKPKEGQIYCVENPEIEGKTFCAAWQNGTCQEAGYRVPYSSIVTEVCDAVLITHTLWLYISPIRYALQYVAREWRKLEIFVVIFFHDLGPVSNTTAKMNLVKSRET